jgi:hypothetical protein
MPSPNQAKRRRQDDDVIGYYDQASESVGGDDSSAAIGRRGGNLRPGDPFLGHTLTDRYQIQSHIKRAAFGYVYRANDLHENTEWVSFLNKKSFPSQCKVLPKMTIKWCFWITSAILQC